MKSNPEKGWIFDPSGLMSWFITRPQKPVLTQPMGENEQLMMDGVS